MDVLELLKAVIQLGVPMAFLSWFMFSWLYSDGKLSIDADRKTISANLKEMKKSKQEPTDTELGFLYKRWMRFGSGFYGLAALWTLIVSEMLDVYGFMTNFPGFAKLLQDGIINLLVGFFINQLGNLITAFIWFSYWSKESVVLWVLVAYIGYWLGIQLAKRGYNKTH